jgi:uncharacterized protein YbbC (DUF1343 family)
LNKNNENLDKMIKYSKSIIRTNIEGSFIIHFKLLIFFILFFPYFLCGQNDSLKTGADQPEVYLPYLRKKSVALVINQTSVVGNQNLVDFLLSKKIKVKRIFAPEHGFRGDVDAGASVRSIRDSKTRLPIISIYGNNKKPTAKQLSGIDIVIFDVQDVGCRFYTYISTLHYVMEACAEHQKTLIILDRPNPNGDYCDGPILRPEFRSFVGIDPIPVVHGCTIGELAQMINGEGWLENGVKAKLQIVPVMNYRHNTKYEPPIKPSPNLPNYLSIRVYPSLCFFEATSVSVGRGTVFPFQVLGYPDKNFGEFSFTPESIKGMEMNPLHKNVTCYGVDLRGINEVPKFTLSYFLEWYQKFQKADEFITQEKWFNLLIGNETVLKLIKEGKSEDEIRKSWENEIAAYKEIRNKYLLYPEN